VAEVGPLTNNKKTITVNPDVVVVYTR